MEDFYSKKVSLVVFYNLSRIFESYFLSLLQFSFVGDLFIVPSDPFGRKGPDIDEFLGSSNNQAPPPPSSSDNNHVSRIRSFNKSEPDKHGKRRPFSENRRPFRSNSRRPGNGRH